MALKKDELREHWDCYQALMGEARAAERNGLYQVAVDKALSSWDYVDGMMQYGRRYEKTEFTSIPAIDLTLRYAPLLLHMESLNRLEGLLKDFRRIEKNTSHSLGDKLEASKALMWEAYRLWDHLERNPDFRQDELARTLGGDQEHWRSIVEGWEKMGLIRRQPDGRSYKLRLATRMGEIISAKCPHCGVVVQAPKAMCLEENTCPECRRKVILVMLMGPISNIGV